MRFFKNLFTMPVAAPRTLEQIITIIEGPRRNGAGITHGEWLLYQEHLIQKLKSAEKK